MQRKNISVSGRRTNIEKDDNKMNRNYVDKVKVILFGKDGSHERKFSPFKKEDRYYYETKNIIPRIKKIRQLRNLKAGEKSYL